MDIVINLLLLLHLLSLGLGGAAVFGLPVVGSKMPTATPETRPLLFKIAHGLATIGRAGVGILLVTGPLMLWLKFGWFVPNFWFWIKMILVLLLLAVVIYAGINTKRAEGGDREAGKRAPMIGMVAMLSFVGVIFSAVFTFG